MTWIRSGSKPSTAMGCCKSPFSAAKLPARGRSQFSVQAEMPGVSKDKLNVQADRNGLLIEGDM